MDSALPLDWETVVRNRALGYSGRRSLQEGRLNASSPDSGTCHESSRKRSLLTAMAASQGEPGP